ncbi:MAG: hypothetical protein AAF937_05920 [Planctomycetota bacterium]
MRHAFFGGVVAAGLAGLAGAQTASFSVSGAGPAGDLGAAGNFTTSGTFTETFVAQSLQWSGTLTSNPNLFFFEEDVFASIEGPNGLGYTGPIAGEQGIFLGTTPFSGWSSGVAPASVNGGWSFEAYTPNTFASSTDWTIADASFAFSADLFPASTPIAVGDTLAAPIVEAEIQWYSIAHGGGGLDISTAGSLIDELDGNITTDDTLIALYDSAGALVEFNDDANGDFTSRLTFADLAAGDYTLAVTGSTLGTRVGASFISTSHDGRGTIQLAITVPAAPSAAVFGVLGIAAGRRRRDRID